VPLPSKQFVPETTPKILNEEPSPIKKDLSFEDEIEAFQKADILYDRGSKYERKLSKDLNDFATDRAAVRK
jgi:hypothetical protein